MVTLDTEQTLFGSYHFAGGISVVGDLNVESICGVNVEELLTNSVFRDAEQTITGKLIKVAWQ